ncbi:hypothetical protein G6F59_017408 [Rhizopus arrhizus]|nr:hypothetical protein G6F59_017408 [Rhizopus arrhizus]
MTDAIDVFLMICTMNPTVGGVAMRKACGNTTSHRRWVRDSARQSAASHWQLASQATGALREMRPRATTNPSEPPMMKPMSDRPTVHIMPLSKAAKCADEIPMPRS